MKGEVIFFCPSPVRIVKLRSANGGERGQPIGADAAEVSARLSFEPSYAIGELIR